MKAKQIYLTGGDSMTIKEIVELLKNILEEIIAQYYKKTNQ